MTASIANTRPPRAHRRRLITWRRSIAACLVVPIGIVAVLWQLPTTRWVYAEGFVMTAREAELRTSVEGAIAAKLVRSGDHVEAKAPVIRLQDRVEVAAHAQAEAQLQARRAQLRQLLNAHELEKAQRKEQIYQAQQSLSLAEGNLKRINDANKGGTIFSRRETEDAQLRMKLASSRLKELQLTRDSVMASQIEVLNEQIDSSRKNVMLRKAELDRRMVRAPMSGTIQFNRFGSGEVVKPEDVLAQVFDHSDWIVKLKISERWIRYVQADQPIDVTLAGYPHIRYGYLPGRTSYVSPVITPQPTGDGVFYAEAVIESSDERPLQPGMRAEVRINTGSTNTLFRLIGW
jgi:HlyD family secretion protein